MFPPHRNYQFVFERLDLESEELTQRLVADIVNQPHVQEQQSIGCQWCHYNIPGTSASRARSLHDCDVCRDEVRQHKVEEQLETNQQVSAPSDSRRE